MAAICSRTHGISSHGTPWIHGNPCRRHPNAIPSSEEESAQREIEGALELRWEKRIEPGGWTRYLGKEWTKEMSGVAVRSPSKVYDDFLQKLGLERVKGLSSLTASPTDLRAADESPELRGKAMEI